VTDAEGYQTLTTDDHIVAGHEPPQGLPGSCFLQVQRHAAFAGVEVEKAGAAFQIGLVTGKWPQLAAGISCARPLNLDGVRTEISQQLGAERPGDPLGQIQHLDACQ
jgi:hypothetical protein